MPNLSKGTDMKFGTSAYLKLLFLNKKPLKTALSGRIGPRTGGYDFHSSMRNAVKLQVNGVNDQEIDSFISSIKNRHERQSAKNAVKFFTNWSADKKLESVSFDHSATISSPNDNFLVQFTPNFAMRSEGLKIYVHVWNTMSPKFIDYEALGFLSLFLDQYEGSSIAILSIPDGKMYSASSDSRLLKYGQKRLAQIESVIDEIRSGQTGLVNPTQPGTTTGA